MLQTLTNALVGEVPPNNVEIVDNQLYKSIVLYVIFVHSELNIDNMCQLKMLTLGQPTLKK
jgi:hypothetical protein